MIEFAPLGIPLVRRKQTLAVAQFVFCFLGMGLGFVVLTIYVTLFTKYWYLTSAYLVFYVIDWKTPENGGRIIEWVRKWRMWKRMGEYFPVTLHKTVDLDPNQNYIFGVHPHGVLCVGSFTNFSTNGTSFDSIFPGFKSRLTMLPFWFAIPFYRDYLMSGGLVPATRKAIQYILNKKGGGNICCIIPGGAPESLLARPGDVHILLKKRFGFLKIALQNGTPLVPVFSFGDHTLWEQQANPPGSRTKAFQDAAMSWMTFALPLFHARGIFQYNYGMIPYRRSVHTVVGEPIIIEKKTNPTKEDISNLQETYIAKLNDLFDTHKEKYASEGCRLIIE